MHEGREKMNDSNNNEINLENFFQEVYERKIIIFGASFFVFILVLVLSLFIPNTYKSTAVLAPVVKQQQPNASGNLSGIASLAGINLKSNSDESDKAIEILKSRKFFVDTFTKYNLIPQLVGISNWDSDSGKLFFDDSVYNQETDEWKNNVAPNITDSFVKFNNQFNISVNDNNGFITLSMIHISPYVAKRWLEILINELNDTIRKKDALEAEKSINYLLQQAENTTELYLKEVFYNLVQMQTEKLMVSKASDQYALEIIDPPFLPENKSSPSRLLISIASFLCSIFLFFAFFFIKNIYFVKKIKIS